MPEHGRNQTASLINVNVAMLGEPGSGKTPMFTEMATDPLNMYNSNTIAATLKTLKRLKIDIGEDLQIRTLLNQLDNASKYLVCFTTRATSLVYTRLVY